MSESEHAEHGYDFPCEIPLIGFGPAGADFVGAVEAALLAAGGQRTASAITTRASSAGRWQSVTVPLWVDSRAELERLYVALAQVPGIRGRL
jgi:putative lipoic acid-binding regulatory protein